MDENFDEKGKLFTQVIKKRPVDVHIQTDHHLLKGKFHVRLNTRLKDELDRSGTFIVITDAGIYDMAGNLISQCDLITVNRNNIIWLYQDAHAQEGEVTP